MNSQIRVTCLLLLGMAPLGAQTGSEARRELRVTADLVVGFRLTVRPEGAARLINRVAGTTEMEYPVVGRQCRLGAHGREALVGRHRGQPRRGTGDRW